MTRNEKKLAANQLGRLAEKMAAQEYIKQGFTVLERQWRMGKTEIDLIMQKDDLVVLAEVKARQTTEEDAMSAVTRDKRKRMVKAADLYLQRLPGNCSYRFDIVACSGKEEKDLRISIHEDAFLAADLF